MIEIKDIQRTYRQGDIEVHALRGVDLSIGSGEFTALAGPSGSGKTTLLNLIGCLDKPDHGSIVIDNQSVTALGRNAAAAFRLDQIGFVFQSYNLLPVLTAYENAEFVLMLQGMDAKKRKDIVVPLMERVGLTDEMGRKPHQLSGGQQQRVAIVRAIANRPGFVLADEPTANLDSETSRSLVELMKELNRESGITFVFSTHDPLVMEASTRLVQMESGRIIGDSAATALSEKSDTERTEA
jgi:putative ABC transport system ATP-binding protein